MGENEPHTLRWPRVAARAAYAILAMVLYALSIGPANYLFSERSPTLLNLARSAYVPVIWVCESTDYSQELWKYCEWWYALPGGPRRRFDERPATTFQPQTLYDPFAESTE